MKNLILLIVFVVVELQLFAQSRGIPSLSFEKAVSFSTDSRDIETWDYDNTFQDSLMFNEMSIDNLDSLADNPNVQLYTGLDFSTDVWLLLHFTGESNIWVGSNSSFSPPGQADRWLITPSIIVGENAVLRWKARSVVFDTANITHESYEVYISSGSGSSYSDFTSAPVFSIAEEANVWTEHEIELSDYYGDTIYVAFRHTSNDQAVLGLDDIRLGVVATQASGLYGDFEGYNDFSLDLSPWTTVDVDLSPTYTITGVSFPNSGNPMSFIVFNPDNTSPALGMAEPHGGDKFAACFAAIPVAQGGNGPNNDWLISPKVIIAENGAFKFWAKSYTNIYGLERFKVGISDTDNNPESFSFISSGDYVEVDTAWTEFTYDLSSYYNQEVYLAINCVSDNSFIFFVDDISIDTIATQSVENATIDNILLYPNPSSGLIQIENVQSAKVSVYNIVGEELFSANSNKPNIKFDLSTFANGIYFVRIKKQDNIIIQKFQLIR